MPSAPPAETFDRTLPLFDSTDRDVIQRLLHYAVEDFAYDHPDRRIARDLYHGIREGEAFRLVIGDSVDDVVLAIDPGLVDVPAETIVDRLIAEMRSRNGEWVRIAGQLDSWWAEVGSEHDRSVVGFEYLH